MDRVTDYLPCMGGRVAEQPPWLISLLFGELIKHIWLDRVTSLSPVGGENCWLGSLLNCCWAKPFDR